MEALPFGTPARCKSFGDEHMPVPANSGPRSILASLLLVTLDKGIGRAVVLAAGVLAFEFADNLLGQNLAEFHAPLIERIDLPDRSLGEDAVLVQGNQL